MKHLIIVVFSLLLMVSNAHSEPKYPIDQFPQSINKNCRKGIAKIYDECSDQRVLLLSALEQAKQTGKSVLVVYGAEWCIWCHVFDKYVKGGSRRFKYKWQFHDGENMKWTMKERQNPNAEREALALNQYVSENFVIAHIDSFHATNGEEAIASTGFDTESITVLPYILSLDASGRYAADMLPYNSIENLEIREDNNREYRGFNRVILLNELKKLREASLEQL